MITKILTKLGGLPRAYWKNREGGNLEAQIQEEMDVYFENLDRQN